MASSDNIILFQSIKLLCCSIFIVGWAFLPTSKPQGLHKTNNLINAYRRCGGQECPPYNCSFPHCE
ncbi:MAG: hypothetical protein IKI11_04130 [Neisseriaceae bacterium]|nr:hypothetical protein [Neisseriaceae bacterium]